MNLQSRLIPRWTLSVAAVSFALVAATAHAAPVTIDWVTVGDPGNANDTTGYGAVATSYKIMKYEFTNADYVKFLNASDPTGANTYGTYNSSMGSDARGGISFTSGNATGSKYAVRTDMGDKPVNFVSWFDGARVSNWMNNGQGASSTETGVYDLVASGSGIAPAANASAVFYLPTEHQWYKAAYYTGAGGEYTNYGNGNDSTPTEVTANSSGVGSAGPFGNAANFNYGADWNSQNGNVTTVGTNGGANFYGVFDMSGNVHEWNDLDNTPGSERGFRGGSWLVNYASLQTNFRASWNPSFESSGVGFRLASPVAVPEPSTCAMGLAGIACAGWGAYRRRRA